MPELGFETVRRVALFMALCAVGCESTAPASTHGTERAPASAVDWAGQRVAPTAVGQVAPPPQVPKDTWVLHIGDSFVHASLRQNLGPRFRAAGSGYVVDATTATYTTTWAQDEDLETWLAKRPALVLVTLGANEVEMPVPAEHARAVEHLAHKIAEAGASCVWITPPMWKRDTGILQVIHDHSAPCLFFDSDAVLGGLAADERQRDHIHPNERGGARWSGAFWGWLEDHRDPGRPGWGLLPFELRGS
jgi:hypothetical protein